MDTWHIVAALASAVLHASWNAIVKASPRPAEAMAAQMVTSAVIVLPGLLWTGLPEYGSWIWIAASTTLSTVIVTALLRAYHYGSFGIVYPVVRALSVLLIVPLAAIFSGETLSLWGLAGVCLIAASLGLLALGNRGDGGVPAAAMGWIALAGAGIAAYAFCDAQGVRHAGSPWAYGFAVSITNAAAVAWRQPHRVAPWRLIWKNASAALPGGAAAVISYMLILWVWSSAPIAPAAALRDTSAVFAILIAAVWLKEPFTPFRLLAVLLSAAAIPLLRLA